MVNTLKYQFDSPAESQAWWPVPNLNTTEVELRGSAWALDKQRLKQGPSLILVFGRHPQASMRSEARLVCSLSSGIARTVRKRNPVSESLHK